MFENPPEDNSRPITLLGLGNNVEGENLTLALKRFYECCGMRLRGRVWRKENIKKKENKEEPMIDLDDHGCTTESIIAMSTFSLVSLLSGLLLAYNHSDL